MIIDCHTNGVLAHIFPESSGPNDEERSLAR